MGQVIGHWKNLTEAQRLTQSQLIPGVIEEDIYIGSIIDRMPSALAKGKSIKWNREMTVVDSDVADVDIGEKLVWTSSIEYDPQETELKRSAIPRLLDNFIADVYGTINNYEAQALWEIKKGMFRRLGHKLIYDDITYGGAKQYDGIHAMAALQTGTDLDIDGAEAGLKLMDLRKMIDAMKYGCDAIFMPTCIARGIDSAYREGGIVYTANTRMLSAVTYGTNSEGGRIAYFDGVPIVRTDYLRGETVNVGDGSNLRAVDEDETNYSIFGIKFGDIFNQEPGLCMAYGDPEMTSKLYKVDYFKQLENYDAKGIRLITYTAPLLGSKLCLGRIFDVESSLAVTAS